MSKKHKRSKTAMFSAEKRAITNEKLRLNNKSILSATKTAVKKANFDLNNLEGGNSETSLKSAIIKLDRASRKNIITKQKAARLKSRLTLKYNEVKKSQSLEKN